MLHGRGEQYWMTKTYEDDRLKALDDRTLFTDEDLDELDIEDTQGVGKYDVDTWTVKQNPFPINTSVRKKIKIDVRKSRPQVGGAD